MAVFSLVAATLLAQATAPAVTVEADRDQVDVGYAELRADQPRAAIKRIEANESLSSDDPLANINLAAAYARLGQTAIARQHYLAAIASPTPCDVELADGRWMDSRRAARLGAQGLKKGTVLALR